MWLDPWKEAQFTAFAGATSILRVAALRASLPGPVAGITCGEYSVNLAAPRLSALRSEKRAIYAVDCKTNQGTAVFGRAAMMTHSLPIGTRKEAYSTDYD